MPLAALLGSPTVPLWRRALEALAYLLALPPVTAYIALNFTGSTPVTSRSGVEREIATYIPKMAWTLGTGAVLSLALILTRWIGA